MKLALPVSVVITARCELHLNINLIWCQGFKFTYLKSNSGYFNLPRPSSGVVFDGNKQSIGVCFCVTRGSQCRPTKKIKERLANI